MPMNLICAVKFVPDPDSLTAGPNRLILNPDDACALAFALAVKSRDPGIVVEVVTLGPLSVRPHMEDLRREVSEDLNILTSRDLGFSAAEVGRAGSLNRVAGSCPVTYGEKTR